MDLTLRNPLIVGNWKMFLNEADSIKLVTALKNLLGEKREEIEVAVAPSYTSLYSVSVAIQETTLKLAAQNCFYEDEGAYTGEISAPFLKELGCEYVIVGHSERRQYFNETNEIINKKIRAILNADLTPIFCVGESSQERKEKKTFQILEQQIRKGLIEIGMHDFQNFVIAYEPIWAIGTGETAKPEQAAEVHSFIRNLIGKIYDAPTANLIRLLYGGSVKPSNASELMNEVEIDGLLVGSASLNAEDFSKIVSFEGRF